MTLNEFRETTKDLPGGTEIEVYVPYEAVLTDSGRGKPELGSIVKTVEHITTKLVEDTVILTTDVTTKKVFIKASKEETECVVS